MLLSHFLLQHLATLPDADVPGDVELPRALTGSVP